MSRGRTSTPLLLALVGAALAVLLVWWLAERGPSIQRTGSAEERAGAQAAVEDGTPRLESHGEVKRRPLVEPATPETAAARRPETATISGRLQVDGFAPFRGSVEIREQGCEVLCTAAIDPFGRFYVEELPARELGLSFRMEWVAERQLLLPTVVVTPAPDAIEVVDLDWTTRHVNVQVLGEDGAPGPARVEILGPGYAASFDTNERGKAKLSLVGSGSFSLRASLTSGRTCEAALELHDGDELESVLIAAAPAR